MITTIPRTLGKTKPSEKAVRLVNRLAIALAEYHGERPGDFGCHIEAAGILIEAGQRVSDSAQKSANTEISELAPN